MQAPLRSFLAGTALCLSLCSAHAQLLIGQTAGFSGTVAAGVKETTDGAKLWINAVNARGGVNGQKIELLQLDDKFDPKLTPGNARVLVEEKNVLALFLTRGTPTSESLLPLLEKHRIALVAPSTGAMSLHQPVNKYVFNVRATYQREAEKALDHLVNLGMTKIALVVADDSFGQDAKKGAVRSFERAKLQPVLDLKVDRQKPNYAEIIPALEKAEAQAVMWIGSGNTVAEGIKALRSAGSVTQVVTLSNNASSGFVKSLGDHARGIVISQVFPNERSISSPMVREAMELAKANGLEVSPAMLEGFAAAKVLVEGLRRAGKSPTRAGVVAALESIQKYDIGGLEVSFSPTDHTGLDFADLAIIGADGKFRR
ncbi:ABC transporter substrate-binding protein [Ramlibacter algicola]|uniref:ABC transporter substrate-binding protein n=1 Tax=Ramlibacter algicola TaxID=2795217 RepID=A0A934Q605_9BURK|nr:ABC transporter substrate-binding protein [Ramlibacter algicola]MBK0394827.1 ABC transporter substrate-binding protein [Ramlibacter algicola]